ncbi:MAG: endolytic transglycosylase MltG [Geobacteraceae bacterium]|nr:endolytic transglycosylase MltG [Geobacteraceae bacterium]
MAIIVASGTGLLLLLPFLFYHHFLRSPRGKGNVVKVVDFSSGSSMKKISEELARARIISSSSLFAIYARLENADVKAKAGTYRFSDAMTPRQILSMLEAGDVYELRFSVPEGYSIYQIAEMLDSRGIFTKESFLRQCFNPHILAELGIQAKSVEGFLCPSTYTIRPGTDESTLIREMVNRFHSTYKRTFGERARIRGLRQYEIVTLASMIEKEAVAAEEKPLIASVFHNRLKLKMPLQSDPTSIYGIRAFAGRITKRDILRDTPYNTYRIKGLPPGPIGNPSMDAIKAVLNPARTRYLYFVAKMDGTHHFSETLEEHNQAVQKYLKGQEQPEVISGPSGPELFLDKPQILIENPQILIEGRRAGERKGSNPAPIPRP